MSLLLIEIDTETKQSKVIEKHKLSKIDICNIICLYFGFESLEELNNNPSNKMSKETLHVMTRQFISYFLVTEKGLLYKEVQDLLNYDNIGLVSRNVKIIQKKIIESYNPKPKKSNSHIISPFLRDPYIRSYNNLLRLISQFNIK
jgi:hypothetical protein